MRDYFGAGHGCIDHELRLEWAVLDHDGRIVHDPLAVLGVVHVGQLNLIGYLPVGACVVDVSNCAAIVARLLQKSHKEAILGEVKALGRQKLGRLKP